MIYLARPTATPARERTGQRSAVDGGRDALLLHFCDTPIEVVGPGDILAELAALYPADAVEHLAIDRLPALGERRFTFEVVPGSNGRSRYHLEKNGRDMGTFDSLVQALAHAEYQISGAAISGLSGQLLVHAAVVARDGAGIIMPGRSRAGKSTLVMALALSGFSYLSDEVAVVDGASLQLAPFLKSIRLREGGWQALQGRFELPDPVMTTGASRGSRLYYLGTPQPAPRAARYPVRYVIVPERKRGVSAALHPLSRAQAVSVLVSRSFFMPGHANQKVDRLIQLVMRAECYGLVYDNLDEAAGVLAGLQVESPSAGIAANP